MVVQDEEGDRKKESRTWMPTVTDCAKSVPGWLPRKRPMFGETRGRRVGLTSSLSVSSVQDMFPTLSLFQKLPCPEKQSCQRPNCLFSHSPDITQVPTVPIPVDAPKPVASQTQPIPSSSKIPAQAKNSHVVPAKRPVSSPLRAAGPSNGTPSREPPSKLQRVGTSQRPAAVSTMSYTSVSTPTTVRKMND